MYTSQNSEKKRWWAALLWALLVHIAIYQSLSVRSQPKALNQASIKETKIAWRLSKDKTPITPKPDLPPPRPKSKVLEKTTKVSEPPKPSPTVKQAQANEAKHALDGRPTRLNAAKITGILPKAPTPKKSGTTNLFEASVFKNVAENPISEGSVVADAYDEYKQESQAKYGPPQYLKDWGEQFRAWFVVDNAILDRNGLMFSGLGANFERMFQKATEAERQQYKSHYQQFGIPLGTSRHLPSPRRNPMMCFGNCANKTHRIRDASVIISVLHDEMGKPEYAELKQGSGDDDLNNAALNSVDSAVEFYSQHPQNPPHPIVKKTLWKFEIFALRWSRADLMLNPSLVEPGKTVRNDIFGKTTVERSTQLLKVGYWPEKHLPSAP